MGNSDSKVEWRTGVGNEGTSEKTSTGVQYCRDSAMGSTRHTQIHCALRSLSSHSNAFSHDRLLRLMPVMCSFPP